MKLLSLVLAASMMSAATVASAQFTNSSSSSTAKVDNYSRIYASFDVTSISASGFTIPNEYDVTPKGFTVGYAYAINITGQKLPLFLEVGGEFTWKHASKDDSETKTYNRYSGKEIKHKTIEYSANFMNISVPVNVTYMFSLADGKFDIAPFIGLNLKYNISAKGDCDESTTITYLGETETHSDSESFDAFDTGSSSTDASRFQVGMNVGVNFYFNNFMVGYRFQPDFNSFAENAGSSIKLNTNMFTLGYRF